MLLKSECRGMIDLMLSGIAATDGDATGHDGFEAGLADLCSSYVALSSAAGASCWPVSELGERMHASQRSKCNALATKRFSRL